MRETHQQRPSLELGWYVKGVEKGWLVWGGHSKRKNDRDEVKQVVRGWITEALQSSPNTGKPLDGLKQGSDMN